MFGILHALFSGTMRGAAGIKNSYEDSCARDKAIEKGELTYWTPHGGNRYVKNGRQVLIHYEDNGDKKIIDFKTGQVYEVIENESRKKYREECDAKGYIYDDAKRCLEHKEYERRIKSYKANLGWASGIIIDRRSGELYNKIYINKKEFLMDMNTGFAVKRFKGYTNNEDKFERLSNGMTDDELILRFNEAQIKRKKEIEKKGEMNTFSRKEYYMKNDGNNRECIIDNDGNAYFPYSMSDSYFELIKTLISEGKIIKYEENNITHSNKKCGVDFY